VAFDGEFEAVLRYKAKAELRRRMRGLRNSIPAAACAVRSERIVTRIMESSEFRGAHTVGLYWPMLERHEVDVRPLDAAARAANKTVAYPFLTDDGDMALLCADPSSLVERGHGFAEPPEEAAPATIDAGLLIVVPALAVDPQGNRIGYGKGFYDRLLTRIAPPALALAVAYDFQVVSEIPTTLGDWAVAMVFTDARRFTSGFGG
jgi:5-formyltetrahydrofolate cyclo-ligase